MLLSGMTPYDTVNGEFLGGWEGGKARKAPAITSPVSETIEHVPRDSGVSGLFGMRRVKEPMSWAASEEPGGPACPAAAAASASGVADDDVLQDFHQIWVGTGKPRAFVLLQAEMSLASATPLRLSLPWAAAARPGEGRGRPCLLPCRQAAEHQPPPPASRQRLGNTRLTYGSAESRSGAPPGDLFGFPSPNPLGGGGLWYV